MATAPRQIRSLTAYCRSMETLRQFRIVHAAEGQDARLRELGFTVPLVEGESVFPPPVGRVSNFNANGREIVRKDLPKVTRTYSRWATWQDWHGHEHSGIQVVSREVYQREQIDPPSEYVTVLRGANGLAIASRVLRLTRTTEKDVLHVVNLFLEFFGSIQVVGRDMAAEAVVETRRLNWKILPRGRYPFERAARELGEFLEHVPAETRPVVQDRIRTITSHTPDFLAIGVGGFRDYVVFGFRQRNIYVLESPYLGNATYVLRDNWEQVAALTKKQILDGSLHEARLIHNQSWAWEIDRAITRG